MNGKLALWKDVCTTWALRGFRYNNIEGQLEWFNSGRIPERYEKATQKKGDLSAFDRLLNDDFSFGENPEPEEDEAFDAEYTVVG